MDTVEAANWTRHFDTMLWQVTSIFAAAIGALLAYSYANFDVAISVAGLFFTVLPVYFAASFRELRNRISKFLDSDLKETLRDGRALYQWQLFVSIFIVFEGLWIWLLVKEAGEFWWLWEMLGVIAIGITSWLALAGKNAVHLSSE